MDTDRLETALDRVVKGLRISGAEFNARYDAHCWGLLTDAERADMTVYWAAVGDDRVWDAMLLRQKSKTRLRWDGDRHNLVPWTDEEKAAERQAFQEGTPL